MTEIVFYDVETTIPIRKGQKPDLIEFGAIALDSKGLYEKECYSTLISPSSLGTAAPISKRSIDRNGITEKMLAGSPTFKQCAHKIRAILHDRVWAGHNIKRFDNPVIKRAFEQAGLSPPQPRAVIDTLPLLKKTFGSGRAGNLKIATLGHYFGLGAERHRALEDCRMNISVLQHCATVLLLEENFAFLSLGLPVNDPQSQVAGAGGEGKQKEAALGPSSAKRMKQGPPSSGGKHEASAAPSAAVPSVGDAMLPSSTSSVGASGGGANKRLVALLDTEIAFRSPQRKPIYISYNGGSNPTVPRPIVPLMWARPDKSMLSAMCLQSNLKKHFRTDRILAADRDPPPAPVALLEAAMAGKGQPQ